jgi:hypothetical protein
MPLYSLITHFTSLFFHIMMMMIIIIIIPVDRNAIQKEAEKILKYKDLTIEIQRYVECKK